MSELNVPLGRRKIALAGSIVSAAAAVVAALAAPVALGQGGVLSRPVPKIPLSEPQGDGRSISVSKQFVIYGKSLARRVPFSKFAENVKSDYLKLIFDTGRGKLPEKLDAWKYPIVIQLREEAPRLDEKSVTSRIRQLQQGGFRLELTALLGDDFDGEDKEILRRELLRLLLAESIIRDHGSIRAGGRTELLPKWLMAGVEESLTRNRHGRTSEIYEKVFRTGKILTVEEILSTDPERLDSVSRKVFEISSAGLLQTLLDQRPSGGNRLRRFIAELATHTGTQRALLTRHFPGLRASSNSLEKWWALEMASMSQPGVFDLMSAEETDAALTEALRVEIKPTEAADLRTEPLEALATQKRPAGIVRVSNKVLGIFRPKAGKQTPKEDSFSEEEKEAVSCEVEEIDRYFDHPQREDALRAVQLKLAEISHRSHPLFRQVVHDYQKAIGRIAAGERKGAAEEFATLAGRRTLIQRQARAIADHLDTYLATQNDAPSGKFEKFYKAVDDMKKVRPARKDPISRYLDALEEEIK